MARLHEIEAWLATFLAPERFSDYAPNGLQVEGAAEVHRVVLGVSASQALFDAAVERDAQAVLVHHGLFWNGAWPFTVRGAMRRRLATLLAHDLSLLAYHLPLDAHPEVGNNAEAARLLGLEEVAPFGMHRGQPIGVAGSLSAPLALDAFTEAVAGVYEAPPLVLPGTRPEIRRVGIVSGGAAGSFSEAVTAGLDAFITGEPSEPAMALAREEGVHFLACGHYRTERLGVQALGARLAGALGVEVSFVDLPNPV